MNLESSFEEVSDSALSFDKSALSAPVYRSVVHAEAPPRHGPQKLERPSFAAAEGREPA